MVFHGCVTKLNRTYGFVRPVPSNASTLCCYFEYHGDTVPDLKENEYVSFRFRNSHQVYLLSRLEDVNEDWYFGTICLTRPSFCLAMDDFGKCYIPSIGFKLGDEVRYARYATPKGPCTQFACLANLSVMSCKFPKMFRELDSCRRLCKNWFNADVVNVVSDTTFTKISFSSTKDVQLALKHLCEYDTFEIPTKSQ